MLRALSRTPDWGKKSVAEIMNPDSITTTPDSAISVAVRSMLENRINCLPVIGPDGRVAGILTTTDLLKTYDKLQAKIEQRAQYVEEYRALAQALLASRRKILVFLSFVLIVTVVMGTVMYVVEGPKNGFTNIPVSVYWAISTMTTVGYGDITPKTGLGRTIASLMMLVGWGTLAVPTGIVSAEFTAMRMAGVQPTTRTCQACLTEGHEPSARYCKDCGEGLPAYARS